MHDDRPKRGSAPALGAAAHGHGLVTGIPMAHAHVSASSPAVADNGIRHDWPREEIRELFALPFTELIFRAAQVHRQYFDPTEIQISTLLSIKTGGCPEDCGYCSQSAKFETGLKAEKLMSVEAV